MNQVTHQPAGKLEKEMEGSTFKVLKVAIPSGAEMPTHHATSEAIIFVRSGIAELTIDGKIHRLQQGDSFLLPSKKPHSLKIIETFEAQVVMEEAAEIEFH